MKVKNIPRVEPPYPFEAYAHVVEPLSNEDGGGFLITLPDLPGCMSDGESLAEAVENGRDAFSSWVSSVADAGEPIPPPMHRHAPISELPGKFIQRVPKTLHARLAARAKTEGVSVNQLVTAYIAEGLGRAVSVTP